MLVLINIFLGFTALASALSASSFVTAELVLSAPGALKFISNGMVVPTTRTPSPVSGIYITVTSISPLTLTASWPTFFSRIRHCRRQLRIRRISSSESGTISSVSLLASETELHSFLYTLPSLLLSSIFMAFLLKLAFVHTMLTAAA